MYNILPENSSDNSNQADLEELVIKSEAMTVVDIEEFPNRKSESLKLEAGSNSGSISENPVYNFEYVSDKSSPKESISKNPSKVEKMSSASKNNIATAESDNQYEDPFKNTNIEKYNSDSPYESLDMPDSESIIQQSSTTSSSYCSKTSTSRKSTTFFNHIDIGLETFPNQRMNMVAKKGGCLTLMVVGQSGLGKSTFINTLFNTDIFSVNNCNEVNSEIENVSIDYRQTELIENNFKLKLSIINCPGFGELIDNTFSWVPICSYVDDQLRYHLFQEEQPNRQNRVDKRVHCCLYFVSPSMQGLTPLDIITMKELSKRVNLIPIIPKAEGYTKDEMLKRKTSIRCLIKQYGIKVCQYLSDDLLAEKVISKMPFSVIGSNGQYQNQENSLVRGRKYQWGIAETDNENHCDFKYLQELLISENMLDLISSTENHYEKYRQEIINFRLFQEEYMNKEKTYLSAEKILQVEDGVLINKFTDVKNLNCKLEGTEILKKINKLTNDFINGYILESDSIYLHGKYLLTKRIGEQVNQQEKKFKDWKVGLYEKQKEFNADIQNVHEHVVKLRERIGFIKNMSKANGDGINIDEDSTSDYDEDEDDDDEDDDQSDVVNTEDVDDSEDIDDTDDIDDAEEKYVPQHNINTHPVASSFLPNGIVVPQRTGLDNESNVNNGEQNRRSNIHRFRNILSSGVDHKQKSKK